MTELDHGPLGRSVARIQDQAGRVVGAGFLIAPDLVATCAHVVAAALGVDYEGQPAPQGVVFLDFPMAGEHGRAPELTTARVRNWSPAKADGSGDIAVLILGTGVGRPAAVPPMRRVEGPWGHEFRALGFPTGMADGVWASGEFRDLQGSGWVQLHGTPNGQPIEEGFSGTPVWDVAVRSVVGMMVAADADRAVDTAYLIPIGQVLGVDPGLLPNPYRGLEAFTEAHAELFHGRDEDIARLLDAVRRRPVVAVMGQSGTGKSSLVRAGLLPVLRREGARIAQLRPLPNVSGRYSLAIALTWLLKPNTTWQEQRRFAGELAARLTGDPGMFRWLAGALAVTPGAPVPVLFLDQFEELAGEDPVAAREILGLVVAIVRAGESAPLRVVLTLRWETVGAVVTEDTAAMFDDATVSLAPMGRTQLREAIVKPTERAPGLYFEPGLVDRILDDAGAEPGQLPLVESLLAQLWEAREGGYVTSAAYEWLGGVSGAVTQGAERALAGFVGQGEPELLRQLFTMLARPDGDGFSRRQVPLTHLSPGLERLADRLAHKRLVVIGTGPDGVAAVELAHQALIDHWPRLRGWLAEDLEFLRWRDVLDHQVARWQAADRPGDRLLRGSALVEAREWLDTRGDELTPAQREFITASRTHRRWRRLAVAGAAVVLVAATAGATLVAANRPDQPATAAAPDTRESSRPSEPDETTTTTTTTTPPPTTTTTTTPPATTTTTTTAEPWPPPPEPPPANCPSGYICFYPQPNYQGTPYKTEIDYSTGSRCRDLGTPIRSVYNHAREAQKVFPDTGCGGQDVYVYMSTGHTDVVARSYKHS